MISGLSMPTEGRIFIDDVDVTEVEPQHRGIGMVFQNYALFPHMNIHKNLSFPLELEKTKKSERNRIIDEVSEKLGVAKYYKRRPEELSGGERQRVAMGRAMVKDSRLYLFDEPLSGLDENLRTKLRPEILAQFQELHVPFVYVTHDQVDAITLGTKVAVMQNGEIQQLGTPREIYDAPANLFVAGFVGSPKMNFFDANVSVRGGNAIVKIGDLELELPEYRASLLRFDGMQITLGIRPEDFLIGSSAAGEAFMTCTLKWYEYAGEKVLLNAEFEGRDLCISAPTTVHAKVGENLVVQIEKSKVHLFDPKTGNRILPH